MRSHWEQLPDERQQRFRFHHISTDELFGSLGERGRSSETTPYGPWQCPEKLIPLYGDGQKCAGIWSSRNAAVR
ncbi:hypothetical protein KQ304_11785 [Synechococcus sp. CS-1329]|nr:hypothetical protein [Synechococcus sp. CS-1329]